MKFDVYFMKLHTRLQNTDFVLVVVLVLVLGPLYNPYFEDENEDECEVCERAKSEVRNRLNQYLATRNAQPVTLRMKLRQVGVSFLIKMVASSASGWTDTRNLHLKPIKLS